MTVTKADIIAARESIGMMPKEAEFKLFGGNPTAQAQAKRDHAIFKERQSSPDYWREKAEEELMGLDGQDLIDGQKAFVQRHSKQMINQVDQYNKLNQTAASGGMLDRYSGSAGALGIGIGALLGGVFGGKSGALIGGLIGGIGLYAMQKLGIGGDSIQNFFKNAVDKVLGPQAGRVDKDKMLKNINAAAKEATGAAPEGPATDATAFGETDPSNPNYNAGESALAPSDPVPAPVDGTANTFGPDHPDDTPQEITTAPPMPDVDYIGEQPTGLRPSDMAGVEVDAPAVATPATDAAAFGETDPSSPNYNEGALTKPVQDQIQPKLTPKEVIQNYKDVQTPTQLPPAVKPVPTGNAADDMEAQIEYENQLNVRKELAKAQQEHAARTKDPAETKRLEDAAIARRHKVKEQMKRQKSAIGRWRDPALSLKEGVGATAEGIAGGFERSGEGLVEGAGLAKDVGKAGLSKIKETAGGAKAVAEEGAGLVKDYANVGTNKAKEFKAQANKWLGDKAKDIKYLFSGE